MKGKIEAKVCRVPSLGEDGIVRMDQMEVTIDDEFRRLTEERLAQSKASGPMSIEEFEADMVAIWAHAKRRKSRKEAAPARMAVAAHPLPVTV